MLTNVNVLPVHCPPLTGWLSEPLTWDGLAAIIAALIAALVVVGGVLPAAALREAREARFDL